MKLKDYVEKYIAIADYLEVLLNNIFDKNIHNRSTKNNLYNFFYKEVRNPFYVNMSNKYYDMLFIHNNKLFYIKRILTDGYINIISCSDENVELYIHYTKIQVNE